MGEFSGEYQGGEQANSVGDIGEIRGGVVKISDVSTILILTATAGIATGTDKSLLSGSPPDASRPSSFMDASLLMEIVMAAVAAEEALIEGLVEEEAADDAVGAVVLVSPPLIAMAKLERTDTWSTGDALPSTPVFGPPADAMDTNEDDAIAASNAKAVCSCFRSEARRRALNAASDFHSSSGAVVLVLSVVVEVEAEADAGAA